MDWKVVRLWGFCLLVLCSVVLAQTSEVKNTQDDKEGTARKSLLGKESKVKFLAVKSVPEEADSENILKYSTKEGNGPVFQIETPVVIRKPKSLIRRRKVIKPSQKKNATNNFENKEIIKRTEAQVLPSDPSIPEESKRIEDVRDGTVLRSSDSNTSEKSEARYVPAHFVPSENFPKIIASNIRQGSSRVTTPFAKGDIKYVLAFTPDSSEEIDSRSDSSEEQFESRRNSQGFHGHQFDSDEIKNQIQSELNSDLARNAFPSSEAQKVTIIKEKTSHSTSSEAAQERVNIEKNPLQEQQTNSEVVFHDHSRKLNFPEDTDNFQPRTINNREEKIILVEGTHIPGRNYGPEDDTFGFHADSYKEQKSSSQLPNGRRVKIVRVINPRPDSLSSEIPLNNHGNGESRQYFVNNKQSNPDVEGKFQSNHQHHTDKNQGPSFNNIPQIQQIQEQRFVPDQRNIDVNTKQRKHNSIPQNQQFADSLPKHSIQSGSDANVRVSSSHNNGEQAIILDINPDPNELYIDQNTGQLIKFVTSDELAKHSSQNTNVRSPGNRKRSNEVFSQRFPENQGNQGLHVPVQNWNQERTHKSGGHNNIISHETQQNSYGNQELNQGGDIQYIEVHDDESIHLIIPPGGKAGEGQQLYFVPTEQTSGNKYQHSQGAGNSNLKDDSEEYVVLCDQEGQDYSGEYQSENLGSSYKNNAGSGNNLNYKSQNQEYGTSPALNHNKDQTFPSNNQGGNTEYHTNSGSRNFQGQKFGSRLNNNNGHGNNLLKSTGQSQGSTYTQGNSLKGKQFGGESNKGVTNFATPPSIKVPQGHYKGDEFSNTNQDSKIPVYRETVTPAYPINDNYPPPTGFNKGKGLQIQQNQGNFKHQIAGIGSSDNYNKGSGFTNQNEYNSGNKGFSGNKGYGGGSVSSDGQNQGLSLNGNGYNAGSNAFSGVISSGHNKGTEFPTQIEYTKGSGGFSSNQGYDSGEDLTSSIKGHNKGSGISNQKNYDSGTDLFSGINAQGINKGSDFSNTKGNDKGSAGSFSNQGYNLKGDMQNTGFHPQGQNKGTEFTNEKGYNVGTNKFPRGISEAGDSREIRFPNQKGFPVGKSGYSKKQSQNLGGGGYDQGISFNEHNINSDISNQKGYSKGQEAFSGDISTNFQNNNDQFSGQKGYTSGNDAFKAIQGFNSDEQLLEILSLKGDRGDDGFLNQKGYNTESKILSGDIFSGSLKGSELLFPKGFSSGSSTASGNKGSGLDLYSGGLSSQGLNKGSELSNNKGYNSGSNLGSSNRGYKTSVSESFSGSLSPKGSNKGIDFSNQNNYDSGLSGNLGHRVESNSFTNNKGYQSGGSSFDGNANNNFKGTPIIEQQNNDYNKQISSDHNTFKGTNFKQNGGNSNDYNKQAISDHNTFKGTEFQQSGGNSNYDKQVISDHNTFKGTDFKESSGNSGYGNQNAGGYSGGSPKGQFQGQQGYGNQNSGGYNGGSTKGQIQGQSGYGNQNAGGYGGGSMKGQFQGKSGYGNQNAGGYSGGSMKGQLQGQSGYGNQNAGGYRGGSMKSQFQGQSGYGNQNAGGYSGGSMKGQLQGQSGYGNQNAGGYGGGSMKGQFQGQSGYGNQNAGGYGGGSTKGQFQGQSGYGNQNSGGSSKGQFQGQSGYGNQNAGSYSGGSQKGQFQSQSGYGNQHAGGYPGGKSQFQGQSGYGNQNSGGYSGGSTKGQIKGQQYSSGNNELGGSYLSSAENLHLSGGQDYTAKEGPVQYILVQEDDTGLHNTGNDQGVYLMQYDNNGQQQHGGNNQEQTYLILDDSNLQQHQNLRVMVDGGKDRTFPIRQLATVGLHMARSVIPQIKKSKAKSIKGKISFGVEIKKGQQSGVSQDYFDSRSDKSKVGVSQRQVPIK